LASSEERKDPKTSRATWGVRVSAFSMGGRKVVVTSSSVTVAAKKSVKAF
jgi:hypothetical protein